MILTENDYLLIKELASLQFSTKDIALHLGLDVNEFEVLANDTESDLHQALTAGIAEDAIEQRKKIQTLAKQGSVVAQKMWQDMQLDNELERIKDEF